MSCSMHVAMIFHCWHPGISAFDNVFPAVLSTACLATCGSFSSEVPTSSMGFHATLSTQRWQNTTSKKKKKQRKKAEKNRGSTEDQKRSRSKKRKNDSKRTVQASQKIKELQTSHGSFYLIGPCPREFYHIQSRAHLIWLSKLTSSILEVVDHSPCYSFRRNRWPTRALWNLGISAMIHWGIELERRFHLITTTTIWLHSSVPSPQVGDRG